MVQTGVTNGSQRALAIDNLSFKYPRSPAPTFTDLSLEIESGKITALLGPNGAGKSTLVALITGLNVPGSGAITVFGESPRDALRRGNVGTMLQHSGLAETATVKELISFAAGLYASPMSTSETLAVARLDGLAQRRVEKLSGGERQRVRFALALVGQPKLLVLDEPTNEMDVASRHGFWSIVRSAAEETGVTVLFTSHQMQEVEGFADRIVVIGGGRILANETTEDLGRRAGTATIRFRWTERHAPVDLEQLTGVGEAEQFGSVHVVHTSQPDVTLREIMAAFPAASEIAVTGGSLDKAYLAVIDDVLHPVQIEKG